MNDCNNNTRNEEEQQFTSTSSCINSSIESRSSSSILLDVVRDGKAELLLFYPTLSTYFYDNNSLAEKESLLPSHDTELVILAKQCRYDFHTKGIAHIPNFLNMNVVNEMLMEAMKLRESNQCFYSTESHNIYQEDDDVSRNKANESNHNHPRYALQQSSKWIIDYDRLDHSTSLLSILYKWPNLRAFCSYVVGCPSHDKNDDDSNDENNSFNDNMYHVKDNQLYLSGCPYNAAYYNIYEINDGLGWHFDHSRFGVAIELQTADCGGTLELCLNTKQKRSDSDGTDDDIVNCVEIQRILDTSTNQYCPTAQQIHDPPVGPGSFVLFAGRDHLHRVTPVVSSSITKPRINAIMTFETQPNQQTLNTYSLHKFFGR